MSVIADNIALAEGARAYIRKVAEALAEYGVEPRFDIHYKGFITGGTSSVTAEGALGFLTDLVSEQGQYFRYRTRIRGIAVAVRVKEKTFSP